MCLEEINGKLSIVSQFKLNEVFISATRNYTVLSNTFSSLSQKQNIRGLLSGVPLSGKQFLHVVRTKETWILSINIKIPLSIFLNFSLCQIKSPI